jgi:hypothetical protein
VSGRDESLAHNETAARELNNQLEERVVLFSGEEPSFGILCECDQAACDQRITVTAAEYERVRQNRDLFFVFPGHEDERIERVVATEGNLYLVVEKLGDAAEVAEDE